MLCASATSTTATTATTATGYSSAGNPSANSNLHALGESDFAYFKRRLFCAFVDDNCRD
jgi:hypothetical protein